MTFEHKPTTIGGKVSILTTLIGVGILFLAVIFDAPSRHVAFADNATTSVTVLNTPPQWVVDAQEVSGSSTSTPTNSGVAVSWQAVANDTSNDNYYLLICKAQIAAVPLDSGAPECGGGFVNRWARSASTASSSQATTATTTQEYNVEFNNWFAYICDGAASGASCNATPKMGSATTGSPFVVNHRPTFTAFVDTSPANPGAQTDWRHPIHLRRCSWRRPVAA